MIPRDLAPVANHLWQSTATAAAAWVLALALRKNRAAVRHGIWLAASLKFLLPFSLLVSVGGRLGWRAAPALTRPQIVAVAREIGRPFVTAAVPGAASAAQTTGMGWPAILAAVWLCGIAAGLVYWSRLSHRLRALRRTATPLDWKLPAPVLESAARMEPGVIGIRKPAVVLPAGISERLTAEQLRAVLAHEMCHVRRRDNLTGAIHMAVETIFWFNPMVWWIGSRLVEERERACDEEVVRSGSRPEVYAESILATCRHYLESPAACVSGMSGADLRKRIEAILANRSERRLSGGRRLLLAAAAAATVAVPVWVGLARGQAPAEFEAASVKLNKAGFPDRFRFTPGGVDSQNMTLHGLIEIAYELKDFQVTGGPKWLDSDHFDVVAKAAGDASLDDKRHMLQTLLKNRFQLAFHYDTKELSLYSLAAAKSGPKLHTAAGGPRPDDGNFRWGQGRIHGQAVTMPQFCEMLALQLKHVVIDRTGLAGNYDLDLPYTPDGYKPHEGRDNPNEPRPDVNGPSIFAALGEQLGLKLEAGKGPVRILVVDHTAPPSEN